MMGDSLHQTELFVGRVTSVYPETYTLSVMPLAGRMGMKYVRVTTQNACALRNNQTQGYFWMPHVNDTVVCAFVEGMPDYPICLGVLFTDTFTKPPQAATKSVGGIDVYQHYDYVVQHQTGSFIRIRNLNQPTQSSSGSTTGEWQLPTTDLPEIVIQQQLANKTDYNEIKLTETVAGTSTVNITHHSGATIQIDKDGNVIITPASGKKIELGSSSSSESLVLGNSFKTLFNTHIHATGMGPSGPALDSTLAANPMDNPAVPSYPHLSVKAKTEV